MEVFLAALQEPTLLNLATGQQIAWLRRVARNKAIDRYRHRSLLTLLPLEKIVEREDTALTPEQQAEQQENYQRLYKALALIPQEQQELVRLRYGHGLHFAEIAELLNRSEGTVRKQLLRAIRRLRQFYEQLERSTQR